MKYGAITLDTSIFDRNGLKLDRGLLKKLEQFKEKPAGLVISEIVLRELHKHLTKKISDTRAQIERALHDCSEYLPIEAHGLKVAREAIIPDDSDEDISKEQIKSFLDRTGAEIVKAEPYVDVSSLIKRYFQAVPPFAESGKKKNEFPDAIALVSLEGFAQEKKFKILAVSTDGDWVEFSKQSEWIDVTGDLAEGMSAFQPQKVAFEFCERLGQELLRGAAENVSDSLESFLTTAVSEIDAYPEADSAFFWDADFIEMEFKEFELVTDDEGHPRLSPIQFNEEELSIEMKVRIRALASCEFSLSVHDSIDKDNVSMGTASKTVEVDFETELLFSVVGDLEGDTADIEIALPEMLSAPRSIDFGTLEPDWWHEDDA